MSDKIKEIIEKIIDWLTGDTEDRNSNLEDLYTYSH